MIGGSTMNWNQLFPPGEPVVALPDWQNPRILISGRSPSSRWTGCSFFPAHRTKARAYRMALRFQAFAGAGEIRNAVGESWMLRDFLGDIVDSPRPPAIQIGTPAAAQKWTIRVADASGKIAAYVKWGR